MYRFRNKKCDERSLQHWTGRHSFYLVIITRVCCNTVTLLGLSDDNHTPWMFNYLTALQSNETCRAATVTWNAAICMYFYVTMWSEHGAFKITQVFRRCTCCEVYGEHYYRLTKERDRVAARSRSVYWRLVKLAISYWSLHVRSNSLSFTEHFVFRAFSWKFHCKILSLSTALDGLCLVWGYREACPLGSLAIWGHVMVTPTSMYTTLTSLSCI